MLGGTDPRATERVGDVLDEKWTLEHLIGAGGMGAVYAARHRNGARAAVKILHPQLARIDEIRERFRREGYAANRVEHRGVVQVLDDDLIKAGPDAGSAYLVMELLEGESLQDRALRDPKLGESDLLEVMDAVLDVLAAAHAHGVIHRDLKPENIFLAKDPEREGTRIKVLDFGLARISESSAVTNAGIAVGTPSYMSPEQAAGRSSEIDGRTDIFALGATIFRIVTGRRLHEVENLVQLVGLMASRPAPRLHSVHPEVSESFARIIDRALAFRRDDRYPDAAAMRDDVRAELEKAGAPTLHVIPFSVRKVPVARPDVVTAAQEEEEDAVVADSDASEELSATPPAPPRSNTLPWTLVLILLAALAWQLGPSLQRELVARTSVANIWTRSEPPPPTSPAAAEVADASSEPADSGQVGADTDVDDGGAGKAEDLQLDAGESAGIELSAGDAGQDAGHDGGPSHVVTAVRAHVPVPHTTKPSVPAKKPAPKKPTPAPTRDPRRR